jgi:hypothetical protein
MVAVHVRNLSATQLSPGYQPLISPTYLKKSEEMKTCDINNFVLLSTSKMHRARKGRFQLPDAS